MQYLKSKITRYSLVKESGDAYKAKVNNSNEVFEYICKNFIERDFYYQETFGFLSINNANNITGIYNDFKGGMTASIVDMRLLFNIVLQCMPRGIILFHNHPSGTLSPSKADKDLTKRIKECGALLDIQILDHLILAPTDYSIDYFSFADKGIL